MKYALVLFSFFFFSLAFNQHSRKEKDSLYIHEVEDPELKPKVLHAEPLYIDLIRDLGARKGEHEWNVGFGITDFANHDEYEVLVEYEFAPFDRLGFEIELPFKFIATPNDVPKDSVPSSKMESLKLATQWSFFVSPKLKTSMALGYINEFVFSDFRSFGSPFIKGNVFNPFLVIAKRWGNNFHTLIYTGPWMEYEYRTKHFHFQYDINTSIHYMIPGTSHFIGVEFNKSIHKKDFDMVIRPQMRVAINEQFMLGIVAGIPISKEEERFSMFTRLIYEPKRGLFEKKNQRTKRNIHPRQY